jgi:hypothetical protein
MISCFNQNHILIEKSAKTYSLDMENIENVGNSPSIITVINLLSKISVYSRVGHRSLVLVVFIGGVTFAEIAALRFLSAQVRLGLSVSLL